MVLVNRPCNMTINYTQKNKFYAFIILHKTINVIINVIIVIISVVISYKGKVKTHMYINRQNQLTTGKL
jgi:hypothetical protein